MPVQFEVCSFCMEHGRLTCGENKVNVFCKEYAASMVRAYASRQELTNSDLVEALGLIESSVLRRFSDSTDEMIWLVTIGNRTGLYHEKPEEVCALLHLKLPKDRIPPRIKENAFPHLVKRIT